MSKNGVNTVFARRKSTSTASYLGSRSALGVERNLLSAFCWFEAARMSFGLWGLSGKGLELRDEFGGVLDSFSILDAFDIALVHVLIGGADGDDSLGPRHLQL